MQPHGYPGFITGCDAVAMGRETFLPALHATRHPWADMQAYVLTSHPLPAETPEDVITRALAVQPATAAQVRHPT